MKKILIVDDEPDHIEILQRRLSVDHYNIIVAHDGDEGLKMAEKERPDLIILDVVMPNLSGHTMAHALRLVKPLQSIPIIITTGKDGIEDQFRIDNVKAFFLKPYDGKKLLQTVQKLLA